MFRMIQDIFLMGRTGPRSDTPVAPLGLFGHWFVDVLYTCRPAGALGCLTYGVQPKNLLSETTSAPLRDRATILQKGIISDENNDDVTDAFGSIFAEHFCTRLHAMEST